LDSIEALAFEGCEAMTSVTLPDSLYTLGVGAFQGCTALKTLKTGNGVGLLPGSHYNSTQDDNYYCYGCFEGCTALTDVTIGTGVTEIGHGAFKDCTSLRTITIPDNVQYIRSKAFYGCSYLNSVVIGNGVTKINESAFANCVSLKTVVIGNNLTELGSNVFAGDSALHYVILNGSAAPHDVGSNIFKDTNTRMTVYVASDSTGWTEIHQAGLPSDGKWQGVNITYAPPPEGAGNPYDFYPCVLTDRVSYKDYVWPSPVLLTTNRYVRGSTIPATCATIREGSPIYLSYAFDEYWRGEAFMVTNRTVRTHFCTQTTIHTLRFIYMRLLVFVKSNCALFAHVFATVR
jgi:hypothetical protein